MNHEHQLKSIFIIKKNLLIKNYHILIYRKHSIKFIKNLILR